MRLLRVRNLSQAVFWGLLLTVFVAGLSGCGGKKKAKVSGKVTYKGNPVTGGTLTLYPSAEKQAPIPIQIQANGQFITTDVPPGSYKVAISTESVKLTAPPSLPRGAQMKPPAGVKIPEGAGQYGQDTSGMKYVQIPPKYAKPETSGLTWDIKGGSQEKDFPLE